MRKFGFVAVGAIATILNSAAAEVEPSSVKASLKYTETSTCNYDDDCDGLVTIAASGAQTFALDSSVTDQFTPDTQISINVIDFGGVTVQLSQDPNYETGDESVKLNLSSTSPSFSQKGSLKMSWKNGECKLAVKLVMQMDIAVSKLSVVNNLTAGLEPGNPENTASMIVRILNGMTTLETSAGFFAASSSESTKVKALPDNGYSWKSSQAIKSRYQVAEPVKMVH